MLRWIKGTFNRLLFSVNILFSILLIGVYLAPWIPPSNFHWLAILAIGYPFLLLINIGFAGWWLYRRKRYFYLSMITIFIGPQHLFNCFGFNFNTSSPPSEALKLMSYNVRYFNATRLSNSKKLDQAQQVLLDVIIEQPVDILCGQEFTGKNQNSNKKAIQFLAKNAGLKYHFIGGGSSLAIFSRYPILKKGTIDFPDSFNGAIYVDVQYNDQKIRIYSFHLQSIRLGNDEREIFNRQNLASLNKDATQEKYKRIGNKLKHAFLLREEQANFIAEHIHNSPYPVLVCGDMNDTPSSYAYRQLSSQLQDAFKIKGSGFGSTYAGVIPFLRIDYTFASPDWMIQNFKILPNTTSDHYPIYTQLKL